MLYTEKKARILFINDEVQTKEKVKNRQKSLLSRHETMNALLLGFEYINYYYHFLTFIINALTRTYLIIFVINEIAYSIYSC